MLLVLLKHHVDQGYVLHHHVVRLPAVASASGYAFGSAVDAQFVSGSLIVS